MELVEPRADRIRTALQHVREWLPEDLKRTARRVWLPADLKRTARRVWLPRG